MKDNQNNFFIKTLDILGLIPALVGTSLATKKTK